MPGCTEIELLISAADSQVPRSTTRLRVEAAVDVSSPRRERLNVPAEDPLAVSICATSRDRRLLQSPDAEVSIA